jgi:uncharacterized protein YbjQ (UPF0145 family)
MADRQGDTKTDLTRLDQLPEMEHHDDPEIDQLFTEQAAAENTGKFSVLEDEPPPEVQEEQALADPATPPTSAEDPFAFQETVEEAPTEPFAFSAPETAADDPAPEFIPQEDAPAETTSSEDPAHPLDEFAASDSDSNIDGPRADDQAHDNGDDEFNLDPLPTENPEALTDEVSAAPSPETSAAEMPAMAEEPAAFAASEEEDLSAAAAPPDSPEMVAPPSETRAAPSPETPAAPPASEFPRMAAETVQVAPPSFNTAEPPESSLQDFASTVFPANASAVAPAYSLKLEDIDPEQHQAIMAIIREAKIYAPADEALLSQSLASGRLLIAHISEYMAVTLAHQLRRLAGELVWGLAQDVHPSPSYAPEENRGNALNSLPGQNQAQSYDALQVARDLNSIILTTAPQVAGHQIKRYLDLITEQAFLRPAQLGPQAHDLLNYPEDAKIDVSEDIASWDIYHELTTRLRQKALAAQADAIINLNFVLHPVFLDSGERGHHLTATGNLVTLTKAP